MAVVYPEAKRDLVWILPSRVLPLHENIVLNRNSIDADVPGARAP